MLGSYSMFSTDVHPMASEKSRIQVYITSLTQPRSNARQRIGPLSKLIYMGSVRFGRLRGLLAIGLSLGRDYMDL